MFRTSICLRPFSSHYTNKRTCPVFLIDHRRGIPGGTMRTYSHHARSAKHALLFINNATLPLLDGIPPRPPSVKAPFEEGDCQDSLFVFSLLNADILFYCFISLVPLRAMKNGWKTICGKRNCYAKTPMLSKRQRQGNFFFSPFRQQFFSLSPRKFSPVPAEFRYP